jgi:hypothetical protein
MYLFICRLFNNAVRNPDDIVYSGPVIRKGYGGKQFWHNVRYYLGICLERLRKTMRNLRVVIVPVMIRIENLPNTSQKNYCLNQAAR